MSFHPLHLKDFGPKRNNFIGGALGSMVQSLYEPHDNHFRSVISLRQQVKCEIFFFSFFTEALACSETYLLRIVGDFIRYYKANNTTDGDQPFYISM